MILTVSDDLLLKLGNQIENHPEYVQSEIEKNNLNNSATSIMS
jgi:hypothetical protein